jgi:GTP cyclohydrolase I
MKTTVLKWGDVMSRIQDLPKGRPWGVPRGGAIVAGILLGKGTLPARTPEEADYILDDIIDSGKTMGHYRTLYPKKPFHALVDKRDAHDHRLGWIQFPWEMEAKRDASDIVIRMLEFIGEDPKRDGLDGTPERVVKSWGELFEGYKLDPKAILSRTFAAEEYQREAVYLDGIGFTSFCEHHLLPFIGTAHIAYYPGHSKRVVGISKLARLVDCFSKRLQIQERMTNQLAQAIQTHLEPNGVAVMVEAKHFCMCCRGVNKQGTNMQTSAMLGWFGQTEYRTEFFQRIKRA